MTRFLTLVLVLLIASMASPVLAQQQTKTVHVDCSHGESINDAMLAHIDPKKLLTVEFTGTCTEVVSVPRDDVTLLGGDTNATIVGRVLVNGRARTRLTSFTIRDTPADPTGGRQGDAINFNAVLGGSIDNVRILNPGGNGITLDTGQIRLRDITVTGCGAFGIATGLSGAIIAGGTIVTNGCTQGGVQIGFGSQLTLGRNGVLEANDNGSWGILIQLQGQLTFFNGGRVTTQRNGIGIQVSNAGSLVYDSFQLDASQNRGFGILVGELADWTPFGSAVPTITITGNAGPGIGVIRGAFMRMRGGTVVSGNGGPGLLVDDADVAFRETTIQSNAGPDALLVFGSTATFDGGNTFPAGIVCDGTALARGQFTCPTALSATAEQKALAERWLAAARDAVQQ